MVRNCGKYRVTRSLAESYCCPTSANRPPRWVARRLSCVGPVLSVPDSSAPSPPGPSGSGLFAGELIPNLGQRKLVLFRFWSSAVLKFGLVEFDRALTAFRQPPTFAGS